MADQMTAGAGFGGVGGANLSAADTAPATENATSDAAGASPYEDLQRISKRIDKTLNVDKFHRPAFERAWFRNILFDIGQQWIIEDKGRWRARALPTWFPKTQSNKYAEKKNDIVSALVQGRVPIRYVPATDDPPARATAEVGERFRDVIYGEAQVDERDTDMELAGWVANTGNGFLHVYYDFDEKFGMKTVADYQCQTCQNVYPPKVIADNSALCPYCQSMGINSVPTPMQDDEGQPVGQQYPIGSICCDVCSPFEIRLDHRIKEMAQQRRLIRIRRYDLEFAQDKWSDFKDVIKQDSETSSGDTTTVYPYLDIIANITDISQTFTGSSPDSKQPKVTAFEFYEMPSEDFPEGLRAVRLGYNPEAVVEAGPLESQYVQGKRKGQRYLPFVHFRFDRMSGRFWGKSRMDDLIPLQVFRNVVEASMKLGVQRMGNSMWLVPKGSNLNGPLTGEQGQVVEYNAIMMGGTGVAKPERIPAELEHVQPLIILMNKIDDTMERVTGTFFLQGGDAPPGVTAAAALAYLGEKAQKSMSPLLRSWAKGWKLFEEYALELARQYWDDDRVRTVAGRNRKWEIETFKTADLQGEVNMIIDYASLFPKSQAMERATIQQLAQMMIVNPADPEQVWSILQKFGETDLKPSMDLDVREAIGEQEEFLAHATQPQLMPLIQNSQVHMKEHTDFAKGDEFKALPPDQQSMWVAHIQATMADIQAKAAALGGGMPGGAGAPPPPGGPQGGPGQQGPPKSTPQAGKPGQEGQAPTPDIAATAANSHLKIQAPRQIAPEQAGGGA